MRTSIIIASIALLLIGAAGALALYGPFPASAAQDPVFHNELGYMLAQEGRGAEAQAAFAAAVALDPQYENARKNLAVMAFQNADYTTAIASWRELASQHPGRDDYRFDLAQALVHQARYADADLAKLEEAATIFESLGSYPHAAENAVIVRAVIAEFS